MRKDEFLEGLSQALAGNVPTAVIQDSVNYYRDYIDDQIQRGIPEEKVIEEIGNPRLIAKTIKDTTMEPESAHFDSAKEYKQPRFTNEDRRRFNVFSLNHWYWKLIGLLLIILIVLILGGIFAILAHFSIPIVIILMAVWCINMIRRK